MTSNCSLQQFPPELLFKIVNFNPPFHSFPSHSESSQKIWGIISLELTCKDLYKKIHSQVFHNLLKPHLHPFFLPNEADSKFSWKKWVEFRRWLHQDKDPKVIHDLLTTGIKQHAFCDDEGKYILYGIYGTQIKDIFKKNHLYKISKEQTELICSKQFFALVSNYNIIYLQNRKTNVFLNPIFFQEGSIICQIEVEEEKLYVMIENSIIEEQKQTNSKELVVFNLSCEKTQEINKQLRVPLQVSRFYLCDQYIFLLRQEELNDSILVACKETLEILQETFDSPQIILPSKTDKISKICTGDRTLFSVTKEELSIHINGIKMDQEKFHTLKWQFSLEEITNQFKAAVIYKVHYHLEKVFIHLSNHFFLVCNLHSKKINYFFMAPPDLHLPENSEPLKGLYFPQIIASSFKIHCLFLSSFESEQTLFFSQQLWRPINSAITRIFTLDYTESVEKSMPYSNIPKQLEELGI